MKVLLVVRVKKKGSKVGEESCVLCFEGTLVGATATVVAGEKRDHGEWASMGVAIQDLRRKYCSIRGQWWLPFNI